VTTLNLHAKHSKQIFRGETLNTILKVSPPKILIIQKHENY